MAERIDLCREVDNFTGLYAKMVYLKDKTENGEVMSEDEVSQLRDLISTLNKQMDLIKTLEDIFGYGDVGIPLEDANFNGFSIKNGELVGDLYNAYLIAEPWYCSFFDGKVSSASDFFKYFIASYLVSMVDMYMPEVYTEVLHDEDEYDDKTKKHSILWGMVKRLKKGA